MSKVARRLLQKVIQTASQPSQLTPIFFFVLEIFSNLQTLSVTIEPLFSFDKTGDDGNSLNTLNQLAYYVHFARILGRFISGNGLSVYATAIGIYLVLFLSLVVYCALKQRQEERIIGRVLSIGFTLHNKVLFYCVHYFLIQSLDVQMNCSSGEENCETAWVVVLIILSFLNFVLAFFKELLLYRPQKTNKDISSANNRFYPLMVLLQKTLVVSLLCFVSNPEAAVISINVILSFISLFLALETFPFHNLVILRINIIFMTLSFGFSLLLIPEIKGSWDYSLFIILAVSSLFVKLSLIRLDYTLKRIFHMESKNPQAAIMLPSLLKEWVREINMMPCRREYNRGTLFLCGFLQGDIQEFSKTDSGKGLERIKAKYYAVILDYFNKLRIKNPKDELLLLAIAQIYAKKLKDIPRTIVTLNYMKTLSPSLAVESVIIQLSEIIRKTNIRNKADQTNLAYENYFEQKEKTIFLKKEIQKEITGHINFWSLIGQKSIDASAVCRKALEIDQLSRQIQKYWQIYFQGNDSTNFEFAVNYGYYLDVVQGLGFEGFNLIKNTYKSLENKAHAKIADDTLDNKAGAILVVSIEPERQGKILNICNSSNSFFEVKKGTMIGMDINSIIPKAFSVKHNESISKVYSRSKLNMSQHPASYVRTLSGQYFKAEVTIQLNSSMDQGLSFVVHLRRVAENESILIVDSNNKVAEFSEDIGKALHLAGKENIIAIETLCPEILKSKINATKTLADLTPRNRLRSEKDWDVRQITKIENEYLKNTETPLPGPFTSHRGLLQSGRDSKNEASLKEEDGRALSPYVKSSYFSFFDTDTNRAGKTGEPGVLRFNIMNNDPVKRKMEFKVVIEEMYLFKGSFYRVFKLQNPQMVAQTIPQLQSPATTVLKTFADCFPEDQEKDEEDTEENTGRKEEDGNFAQLKPGASAGSNEDHSASPSPDTKEMEIKKEKAKLDRIITFHKIENKKNQKAESIASSQFSTKILAKNLISLFRENKINRLTQLTIHTIYLTVFIVILVATIDTISTKASLKGMQNAVSLVDLINKRLYKGVFAWQTGLFIMTFAFGVNSVGGPGGGGGPPGGGPPGGGPPPSSGPGGGGIGFLQPFVKTAVLDAIENNNLLQKEVIQTKERGLIEALYAKSIVMWDPEEHTASYFDSFRANEILAHDNMFIANFAGDATDLKYEPDALSAANNTANSYLIEVEHSIEDVTNYFIRTKEGNVRTLTTIFSVKSIVLLVLFLFICKLFQNILLAYRRLFKYVSKVPQETLQCRINQLEILKHYFEVDNTSIYDSTNKRALEKHFNKDRASMDVKSHNRLRFFSLRQLILYMLKYLLLALLFIVPSIVVFAISYHVFQDSFSNLEEINNKMLISYRLGTQASMILPSFYFYRSFQNLSDYKIRNGSPLDQFYLSVDQLNKANEILLTQVLTPSDDDQYVHDMFTSNICNYVTADFAPPCSDATGGDSGVGLLDVNSKYHLVATEGMSDVLNGQSVGMALDPYSLTLKDSYQTLAQHFLDLFQAAVYSDLSSNSYHVKLNVGVILVSAILIRVFVLTRFKDVDIGIRKTLRVIPYQIIEDQKAFMQYLKREFREELDKHCGGKSSSK